MSWWSWTGYAATGPEGEYGKFLSARKKKITVGGVNFWGEVHRKMEISETLPDTDLPQLHLLCQGFGVETSAGSFCLSVLLGVTVQIQFIPFGHIFALVNSAGTGKSSSSPKTLGMKYSGRFLSQKPEEFQIGKLFSSSKTQTNLTPHAFSVCLSISELTF